MEKPIRQIVGFDSLSRVERRGGGESLMALRPRSLPPTAMSLGGGCCQVGAIPRVVFATYQLAQTAVLCGNRVPSCFLFPSKKLS